MEWRAADAHTWLEKHEQPTMSLAEINGIFLAGHP